MRLGALRRWDSRLRRHRSALVPEAGKYPGELCRVLETPEHWARHQGAVFDRGEADLGEGRVVAVLHLRLSAAEWDVWIPRCRGSAVRRAVPPAPSGAGPPEPRALAGREGLQRRTGRGAEVAPQVWGRFRDGGPSVL